MALESSYEIARPTGVCAETGRTIVAGEFFVAALIQRDGQERLERRDFSMEGWASGAAVGRAGPNETVLASWRATMPHPDDRRARLIDDEGLLDLFDDACRPSEDETPGRAAFRYLLALLLIRRRMLKHTGTRPGSISVRRSGDGEHAEVIEIADPGMDAATIAAGTGQLSAVLIGAPAGEER